MSRIIIEEVVSDMGGKIGVYSAMFEGEELCRSKTPLWHSAHALLARGYPPDFVLEMARADGVVSMRGPIGKLAANLERKHDVISG